jgi:hypothetical protein
MEKTVPRRARAPLSLNRRRLRAECVALFGTAVLRRYLLQSITIAVNSHHAFIGAKVLAGYADSLVDSSGERVQLHVPDVRAEFIAGNDALRIRPEISQNLRWQAREVRLSRARLCGFQVEDSRWR